MESAPSYPNQHLYKIFREKHSKLDLPCLSFCSATTRGMDKAERMKAAEESNPMVETSAIQDVYYQPIIPGSSHRDGTIYKKRLEWESEYCVDVDDRTETQLEPASWDDMTCEMMQIFSLKLAKSPINSGSMQLYGYIAARDEYDLRLNYLFNRSREDPIVVQQGSLIQMTGPKRGIAFHCDVLLEFDMRIKNGENKGDDTQLIDGMSEFRGLLMPWEPTEIPINGNCATVEMSAALVSNAIAATVEVIISEAHGDFDLSLSSIVSVVEEHEFQLFHGSAGDWCGARRFVIAVTVNTMLHLKFMLGHRCSNGNIEDTCSFKAKLNGHAIHQTNFEAASILTKVTWAAWPHEMFR